MKTIGLEQISFTRSSPESLTSVRVGVYSAVGKFLSIHLLHLSLYIQLDDKSRNIAPHPINTVKMADTPTNGEPAPVVLPTNERQQCLCLLALKTTTPSGIIKSGGIQQIFYFHFPLKIKQNGEI